MLGMMLLFIMSQAIAGSNVLSIVRQYPMKKTQVLVSHQESLSSTQAYHPQMGVKTDSLTPGEVMSQSIDIPQLARPIYLVGDDQQSLDWLVQYKNKLKALHAIGFIVNVQNNKNYEAIKEASGLPLIPINGQAIAHRFGITHYPVLISQHQIEQ